jgi:IclR family acetate operon transcriptional repressor
LLASGTDEELEAYVAHARRRALPPSAFDAEAFRAEIALARRRGYSIDDGESSPGVRCLAVAVRGVGGSPLFAISLTGPSGRFTVERLASCVPEMLAVANELTTRFGGEATSVSEAVA